MSLKLDYKIKAINPIISVNEQANWGYNYFDIRKYWSLSKGGDIRIAVLDTGLPQHSDLVINTKLSRTFVDYEDIYDHAGHSTAVCGIINSQNNHFGTLGIAPESEIISLKILDENGSGNFESFKKALEYCLNIHPNIINISSGSEHFLGDDIERLISKLQDNDIYVVCGAGNQPDKQMLYPAKSAHTISIGSIERHLELSKFSSRGSSIDFVMPGEDIFTTYLNNSFSLVSGTSFATPFFSGVLSLYLSFLKNYDFYKVLEALRKCSVDLGIDGYDDFYGLGTIDMDCLFYKIDPKQIIKKLNIFQKIIKNIKLKLGKYF